MITIEFIPWSPFRAVKDLGVIQAWLHAVGAASERAFKGGMGGYPPASSPGQYPAVRTGMLRSSVASEVTGMSMTVGSSRSREGHEVARYLREGTSRMARRKMSDDALREAMQNPPAMGRWAKWERF